MKNSVKKNNIPNPVPFCSAQMREVIDPERKRIHVPTDDTVEECARWVQKKKS